MEKKLTLTAGLAAALTGLSGCGPSAPSDYVAANNTRVCVDSAGQRIDDDYCEDNYRRTYGSSFVYLRRGSPIPFYYDNINDRRYAAYASRTPPVGFVDRAPAATNMARSTAVSRGGLGRSSRSFGRGG